MLSVGHHPDSLKQLTAFSHIPSTCIQRGRAGRDAKEIGEQNKIYEFYFIYLINQREREGKK